MQCTLRWASSSSRHQHVFAHLQCCEGHVLYSCLVGFHFRCLDVVPWESAARQDLLLACRTGATLYEFQTCHWTRYQPLVCCVSPRPEAQKARTCCSHCPLCWPLVVLEDHSLLAGSSPAPSDGLPLLSFDVWMCRRKLSQLKFGPAHQHTFSRSRSSRACGRMSSCLPCLHRARFGSYAKVWAPRPDSNLAVSPVSHSLLSVRFVRQVFVY
jgi:hypothetical protein